MNSNLIYTSAIIIIINVGNTLSLDVMKGVIIIMYVRN